MNEATYQRPLAAGEMIDVFRIERELGAGGFGITYLATDTALSCPVAIKEYFPQTAWRDQHSRVVRTYEGDSDQSFRVGLERFRREGQTLAQFNHPNIVRVKRLLEANNTAYLVMDYEQGETLGSYIQRVGRPLTYQEVEAIFNPLLDGLRAVHERGLLHLDIKPGNIFLRNDSTPVLIDFGGARHQLGQASHVVSFLVASDGYAPNEQYSGTQLQPYTDIYAVGATIYYSITGSIPLDSPSRASAVIDGQRDPLLPAAQLVRSGAFPAGFLQAVEAALSMPTAKRPQSVREFQQRLFIVQPQVVPPPPPPIQPPSYSPPQPQQPIPPSRSTNGGTNWMPVLAGVGGIIALLLVVVLVKMSGGSNDAQNVQTPATLTTTPQTDASILELQKQNTQQEIDALKRQKAQLDEENRQAEEARQAAAKRAEEDARQAALDTQRRQEEEEKLAEQSAKDELIDFFKRYYNALNASDVSTFASLWDSSASQAEKSIKLIRGRKEQGLRGRGCTINNASLNSLSSSRTRASIYIDATCDLDGKQTDRFRSTFDLEKDGFGQWKLVRQTSS